MGVHEIEIRQSAAMILLIQFYSLIVLYEHFMYKSHYYIQDSLKYFEMIETGVIFASE